MLESSTLNSNNQKINGFYGYLKTPLAYQTKNTTSLFNEKLYSNKTHNSDVNLQKLAGRIGSAIGKIVISVFKVGFFAISHLAKHFSQSQPVNHQFIDQYRQNIQSINSKFKTTTNYSEIAQNYLDEVNLLVNNLSENHYPAPYLHLIKHKQKHIETKLDELNSLDFGFNYNPFLIIKKIQDTSNDISNLIKQQKEDFRI